MLILFKRREERGGPRAAEVAERPKPALLPENERSQPEAWRAAERDPEERRPAFHRLGVVALALLAAGPVDAATLRTMTTLHGPNVYLRDLFEDAGSNADRLLGPGPNPGGRIVVEAPQLNAIARQYSVAWHSLSRGDRAVLDWPGRPLRRDEAVAAIRGALANAGAPADADIELPGFSPPLVPADTNPDLIVAQADYDPNSGRFTVDLNVAAGGMRPVETRVTGEALAVIDAPVALTRLVPETILRPEDLRMARVPAAVARSDVARGLDQVVGMELKHPVAAGQPLHLADLVKPPLVQRGALVRVGLEAAGLIVSGEALAMDSGAEGETVRIQNTTSKAYLFARVVGRGQVRVDPGAPSAVGMLPARLTSEQ